VVLAAVTAVLWAYAFTGTAFTDALFTATGSLSVSGDAPAVPAQPVTRNTPTPANPTPANPTPANPTSANPTSANPTSANPTSANPTGTPSGPMTSLWFGDSIVAGCCRTESSARNMAQVASAALGWPTPQVHGFPGTGYTTSAKAEGKTARAYEDNIGQYVDGARYRVVIIAGGNNDARKGFSPGAFRAAVRSTFDHVRRALPDAKLVVLGPYSPSGTGYTIQRTIEREEAARVKASFVDGIDAGWFKGQSGLISKDGFSPNDAGQAYLGIRMGAELKKLGLS
jgi:lysophospholipase L1-like esterase